MGPYIRLLTLLPLLGIPALAAVQPYISTSSDIRTECKTCPRSLCPNVVIYGNTYDDAPEFNATCWTRGTWIVDGNLWLRTNDDCYVTQYDIVEHEGEWEKDLVRCTPEPEQHLTLEDATLQYKGECRYCTGSLDCDVLAYLPEDTDVTLTCWTDDGLTVLDDSYWFKSTNNCYISQTSLYNKPDITYLDNCGPMAFLEFANHNNENGTSDVNSELNAVGKRDPFPIASPSPIESSAKYLVEVTVGEEWAYCRDCPHSSCKIEERYPFNASVILQCLTPGLAGENQTLWTETTDFCYVKGDDFWESPAGDYYRMPWCEYFEDPAE